MPMPMQNPAMAQKITDAKPGDVRVLATAAIAGPLEAVRAQAQAAAGRSLVIEYGSARGNLKDMVIAGQPCDVVLLLPDVDATLVKEARIESRHYRIASAPVALALRGEAPATLDVSSAEGIKSAMLNAAAVRYASTGAARDTVNKILDTLDIRSAINDVSGRRVAMDAAMGPGQYEMNVFPLSEILPNKSLRNLGLVIPELQVPAVIEASLCKKPGNRRAAMAFIRFLQGPAIEPALQANGMTR
jgi:ABC-type molybdate transport system substrate-binding protein